MQRAFPRLVLEQPRPAADRRAHRSGTMARSLALWRHAPSSGKFQKLLRQLLLLRRAQQFASHRQREPQRPHRFPRFEKAHAQPRRGSRRRPRPFPRPQRAGPHPRCDFLRAGFGPVALPPLALAPRPFQCPVIQFGFPAPRVAGAPLAGRRALGGPADGSTNAVPARDGRAAARARGFRALESIVP